MPRDVSAAAILASALWLLLIGSIIVGGPPPRHGQIWIVTASEKVRSHPALARAELP